MMRVERLKVDRLACKEKHKSEMATCTTDVDITRTIRSESGLLDGLRKRGMRVARARDVLARSTILDPEGSLAYQLTGVLLRRQLVTLNQRQ